MSIKIKTILEKKADLLTELVSNINPINVIGKPFAALGALATPTWTDEQLQAADLADSKERARQLLLPGLGDYNVWKRIGHSRQKMLAHEKNQNKQAAMDNAEQAYINGFVKRASEYGINEQEAIELLKTSAEQAPYSGVKTLGEMWNEFKSGKPTMATKLPVSVGAPAINPKLAVK